MSVAYNPRKPKWPDANEYHPVEDFDKVAAALKDKAPFGFKVGNGDLYNPQGRAPYFSCDSDVKWKAHLEGAESRGLITVGYWWGPQAMDVYLKMYPPKEGRIPALDFEGSHVNDPDWFARSATRLHSEWGRWPWFYGGISWRTHGKPGTSIENCPYWPPGYNGEWIPTSGVGPTVAHQYAASCRGPAPHSFPGVNPCSDMNTLLVPFAIVRKMAGLIEPPPPPPSSGGFMAELTEAEQREMYLTIHAAGQALAKGLGLTGKGSVTAAWTQLGANLHAMGQFLQEQGFPKP